MQPEVAIGKRARFVVLTETHGAVRPGLIEEITPNPARALKVVHQVGSEESGRIYGIFEGVPGEFTYLLTNQNQIAALISDTDPASVGILDDHFSVSRRRFSAVIRQFADDRDVVIGSQFLYAAETGAVSDSIPAADAQKRKLAFTAKRLMLVQGQDMAYIRIRKNGVTQAATPTPPVLTEAAGTSDFGAGEMVYVRTAIVKAVHVPGDAAPTAGVPMTQAGAEVSKNVITATDKVVATFTAPGGGNSLAIFVGRASGQETFYAWAGAADTTTDITHFPDVTAFRPVPDNQTASFHATQVDAAPDRSFTPITEGASTYANAIDLFSILGGKVPLALPKTGLRYVAVLKNGLLVPDFADASSVFGFTDTGRTFFLSASPTDTDVWEIILPVDPN